MIKRCVAKYVEPYITRYLDSWYGNGEDHQVRFYRCEGCRRLVTWKMIRTGGCSCGISNRLRPARLTKLDKVRALFLPWTLNRLWPPDIEAPKDSFKVKHYD